jgi:parvulin-like peptidyl-prolyl isomerase
MFRRVLIVLAAAMLVASCSFNDTLATVNGVAITKADLIALNPAYEQPLGVLTGEDLRQNVTDLIVSEATKQAAAKKYGVVIDEATISDRLANPPERYASMLTASGDSPGALRGRAIASLIVDGVSPQLIAAQYDGWAGVLEQHPELVSKECVRHINVATEAEANDVLTRLQNGEDFIDLANELSLDTTSKDGLLVDSQGNCLGSFSASAELAATAATAELNVPVGPIALGGGYSIIRVEQRVAPASAEELAADPMKYLDLKTASDYYFTWASDELRAADIEVTPALGTWSAAGFGISPPGGE